MARMPVAAAPTRYHFTADEYEGMIRLGLLRPEARLELLEGEIVEMSPIGGDHAACVRALIRLLTPYTATGAILDVQNPIRLAPDSQPQPDVLLLHPRADLYKGRHPQPTEVQLLVEVGDTTADFDRATKLPLYARAGITEVWLVNLPAQIVEICTQPTPQGYGHVIAVGRAEAFQSAALGGASILAAAILL